MPHTSGTSRTSRLRGRAATVAALAGATVLLAAVPVPNPRVKRARRILQGDVPSPMRPPPGCTFHTRCPIAVARCREETPLLRELAPGHVAACHLR